MPTILRLPRWSLYLLMLVLAVTAFLYLGADFPNHSRWTDDAARYTDDAWYIGGAINHALTGRWLHSGDFNAMVPVPAWPLLIGLVFHFTGVSVIAARAIAICFAIATVLLAGVIMRRRHPQLAPAFMLLVAASPIFFFFSRTALIEPSLIFLITASLWAAYTAEDAGTSRLLLCGLIFAAAMIDKSNAIFAAPAVFYLIWFPYRTNWRHSLRPLGIAGGTFVVLEVIYLLLWVHPHQADFVFYSSLNTPTINLRSIEKFIRIFYRGFTWLDPILFPIAGVAFLASLTRLRSLWKDPLFGSSILFVWGWIFFMVLHVDAGPHYLVVIVFPIMLALLLVLETLDRTNPNLGSAFGALLLVVVVLNLGLIVKYMVHPQYTLRDACLQMARKIDADPSVSRLVIGHASKEITLYTGIPALDDMGIESVADKMHDEHPGWIATYEYGLPAMETPELMSQFKYTKVGEYPVLDQDHKWVLMKIETK